MHIAMKTSPDLNPNEVLRKYIYIYILNDCAFMLSEELG